MALELFLGLLLPFVLHVAISAKLGSPDVISRLTSIEDKISTIQQENEDLRLENKQLYLDNEKLKASFRILESKFELQKKESQDIKRRLSETEREISIMKSKRDSLQGSKTLDGNCSMHPLRPKEFPDRTDGSRKEMTLAEQKNRLSVNHIRSDVPTPKLSSIERHLHGHRTQTKRLLSLSANAVGQKISFSVHMNLHMRHLGINQKIIFDVINNNEGGGYDRLTGVFTCPVSGSYFFNVGLMTFNAEEVHATITVNNINKAYIDTQSTGQGNAQASNSLIIHCNKGDEVWIKHFVSDSNNINGSKYSHFCGFMLWAD